MSSWFVLTAALVGYWFGFIAIGNGFATSANEGAKPEIRRKRKRPRKTRMNMDGELEEPKRAHQKPSASASPSLLRRDLGSGSPRGLGSAQSPAAQNATSQIASQDEDKMEIPSYIDEEFSTPPAPPIMVRRRDSPSILKDPPEGQLEDPRYTSSSDDKICSGTSEDRSESLHPGLFGRLYKDTSATPTATGDDDTESESAGASAFWDSYDSWKTNRDPIPHDPNALSGLEGPPLWMEPSLMRTCVYPAFDDLAASPWQWGDSTEGSKEDQNGPPLTPFSLCGHITVPQCVPMPLPSGFVPHWDGPPQWVPLFVAGTPVGFFLPDSWQRWSWKREDTRLPEEARGEREEEMVVEELGASSSCSSGRSATLEDTDGVPGRRSSLDGTLTSGREVTDEVIVDPAPPMLHPDWTRDREILCRTEQFGQEEPRTPAWLKPWAKTTATIDPEFFCGRLMRPLSFPGGEHENELERLSSLVTSSAQADSRGYMPLYKEFAKDMYNRLSNELSKEILLILERFQEDAWDRQEALHICGTDKHVIYSVGTELVDRMHRVAGSLTSTISLTECNELRGGVWGGGKGGVGVTILYILQIHYNTIYTLYRYLFSF